MNASTAASAGPVLPIIGELPLADPLVSDRMTPDPCSVIRRAAARAVRNCEVGPVVESVDLGHIGGPAVGRDVGGDRLQWLAGAAGEEDPGPLPSEGPGDAAADPSAGAVDDGVLVLEQHLDPPVEWAAIRDSRSLREVERRAFPQLIGGRESRRLRRRPCSALIA